MSEAPNSSSSRGSPKEPPGKGSEASWFTADIQSMMHGLGDYKRPLRESAVLIEDVVRQELLHIVRSAVDIALQRNSKFVGLEDILFIMRKDKMKLQRLIHYLEVRDMKALKAAADGGEEEKPFITMAKRGRKKVCYDVISSFDTTGELLKLFSSDLYDPVKQDRNSRLDKLSQYMDHDQYLEFCMARQVSFAKNKSYQMHKFRDWVTTFVEVGDLKLNALTLEVLCYLAFEVVAQIVDLCLLVKRDMAVQFDDPLSHCIPPACVTFDPAAFQYASLKTQMPATVNIDQLSNPYTMLEMPAHSAIQPCHVREALRRYQQSKGPFVPFSKQYHSCQRNLLSC